MSIDDQINLLTKNEMIVLYWKCKGLNYEQIRLRLAYSKDWVQLQMSTVYAKLGFEKSMHWTKRVEILNKEVCPQLPKNIDDWEPVEVITEVTTVESKEDHTPNNEMLALVIYDEKELEKQKSKALTPQKEKVIVVGEKEEENPWAKILRRVLFAVVSLLIVSTIAYFAYNFGRGATPAPETVVITATFPPITETSLETSTSPIPTDTVVPTSTSTSIPTNTPIPTEFVPPADGILFEDDFESGDLSAWTQVNGKWLVFNGQLTVLGDDNDSYKWIALKRPEWKNYILSLTVYQPYQGAAAQSDVLVTIRNNGSQLRYLGVPVDNFGNVYWAFIGSDMFDNDVIAGNKFEFGFASGSTMELEIQGDTYILRVNGRELQRITMSGYDSGGISLGIDCYTSNNCASFDNLKVTYLP